MSRRGSVAIVLLALLSGCKSSADQGTFHAPRSQVLARVGVVSVAPARLEEAPPELQAGFAAFGRLLEAELAHLGYRVGSRERSDAVLQAALEVREANVLSTTASWDGRTESFVLYRSGPRVREPPGTTLIGDVAALSLKLSLVDPSGELLYESYGGIRLLTKFDRFFNDFDVPEGDWLNDREHNERAVEVALAGLRRE